MARAAATAASEAAASSVGAAQQITSATNCFSSRWVTFLRTKAPGGEGAGCGYVMLVALELCDDGDGWGQGAVGDLGLWIGSGLQNRPYGY